MSEFDDDSRANAISIVVERVNNVGFQQAKSFEGSYFLLFNMEHGVLLSRVNAQ